VLAHRTDNLGDDIQALAARQYWPRVDHALDRDNLSAARRLGPLAVILNGWFLHPRDGAYDWPPPPNLLPLLVSHHLHVPQLLAEPGRLRYYERHQPIGCRDHATVELFRRHGLEAYFSGCLTLTLPTRSASRHDGVVFCDPFGPLPGWRYPGPDEPGFRSDLWRRVPAAVRARARFVTHWIAPGTDAATRTARAEALLDLYARAAVVVTSRLHCALPCLALGTPVILLVPGPDPRFEGLLDLLPWYPLAALERGTLDLPLEAPPPAPAPPPALAAALAGRCRAFAARHGEAGR
jgi:hypothetical protein